MRPRADLASFIGSSNFGPAEIRYFFMRREGSMRRRDVIAGLSVAAFWPLTARAEQPTMRVVGYLSSRSPDESAPHVAAFRQGLAEAGAVEGKNIAIEYRWAKGEYDRLPALATELVQRKVAVLATVGGEPSALAAKAATATIPIVAIFTTDPIKLGIVASLGRPEGNITGISVLNAPLEAKRLGLLRDLLPQATKLAVLVNPTFPAAAGQSENLQQAACAANLAGRCLCRSHSQWEQACRPADHPADQVRPGRQPKGCQIDWPDALARFAFYCRRGDRIGRYSRDA